MLIFIRINWKPLRWPLKTDGPRPVYLFLVVGLPLWASNEETWIKS